MKEQVRGIVLPTPTVFREDGMRLRGFDVKMYPRWPSKPLSREAYDEMRDLFAELKIIGSVAKAVA